MKRTLSRMFGYLNCTLALLIAVAALPAMYFSYNSTNWTAFFWQLLTLGFALDYLLVWWPRKKRRAAAAAASSGGGQ